MMNKLPDFEWEKSCAEYNVHSYEYSPLTREELIMVAYNEIAPSGKPRMTIQEAVDVVKQHTPMVSCLGKMVRSKITSIDSINQVAFKCDINGNTADISSLDRCNEIILFLEQAKRERHKGYDFLEKVGIVDQIRNLGKEG